MFTCYIFRTSIYMCSDVIAYCACARIFFEHMVGGERRVSDGSSESEDVMEDRVNLCLYTFY